MRELAFRRRTAPNSMRASALSEIILTSVSPVLRCLLLPIRRLASPL